MNKLAKILLAIGVVLAIAVAIIYFMGQFEATKPIANAVTNLSNQATAYVKGNIPTVTAYATTVTAAVGGALAIKKSAENKLASVTKTANTQIDGLVSEKTKLAEFVESQKTQLTGITTELEQAKTTALEATEKLRAQELEITSLRGQLTGTQDTKALGLAYSGVKAQQEESGTNVVPAEADVRIKEALTPVVA